MVISALPSLASPQQALDARATDTRGVLYIGGVLTPYLPGLRADFALGDTATGRITLPLPRPPHVTTNATIEWQSGHNDFVGTTLSGFVPDFTFAMTSRGDTLELIVAGWKHLLTEPFRDDIVYQGPVDAGAIFVDLCERARVPAYIAEAALTPSGSPLLLGGNAQIDGGAFTIKANSSPIGQFEREVNPFGMYVSDFPIGATVLHRVLGTPAEAPVVTFREGIHLGDTRRSYVTRDIVNVWDVRGATYEDAYGGEVPIRSIADPDTVPPHPEIPSWMSGYRYRQVSNSSLVRDDLADAYREALEIEHAAADAPVRFEAVGVPGLAPGDAVEIDAETVEVSGRMWLVSLSLSDDDGGLMGDYEVRAGAGVARPGIKDRITVPIDANVWHGGDETVGHYKHPAPQGKRKTYTVHLPEGATAVNVRGYQHSWNSQTVAGKDTTLTVTRWEAWVPGTDRDNKDNRAEASHPMPHMPERYYERPNFSKFVVDATKQPGDEGYVIDPGEWTPFAAPLGRLDPGTWEFDIACGDAEGLDDGEVIAMYAEVFGTTAAAGGGS